MVKLLSNGKKFVKFCLRIIPIFILLMSFLSPFVESSILKQGGSTFVYNVDESGVSNRSNFINFLYGTNSNFSSIFNYNRNNILSTFNHTFVNLNDINYNLVQSTSEVISMGRIDDWDELSTLTSFIICTLYYELEISFLFLIFDVFNYMFTIAERFLNKEERLGEK